jgi:membrane fusion protein (multidrug efflux system)
MKSLIYLLVPAMILASCGGKNTNKTEELTKLKKERADLDVKIKAMEGAGGEKKEMKATPVSVAEMQPVVFYGTVEVQAQITGDANVVATAKAPGTVNSVLVQVGQHVSAGQVLATLDATTVNHQIETLIPALNLQKALYEKQKNLWKENIGTEVQLMQAKTQVESTESQIASLKSQRDLYRVVSPISGTVDAVGLKVGDAASPGFVGIRVVSTDKLKAEASIGENYLGKIKPGNPVTLIFPDLGDSIKSKVSYVASSIDVMSRTFPVQIKLGSNSKLRPNMSCIMKIANYENAKALVIPVSVIQKTAEGAKVYIADGNKAKLVPVVIGRMSNGMAEVVSGLQAGDKVVVAGYQDLDDGESITIM